MLDEITLDAGGVLLWNRGPCCPQQTENREGRYFRVIGQEAKVVTPAGEESFHLEEDDGVGVPGTDLNGLDVSGGKFRF